MPPEQLVDVPVPQVPERFSRSLVYEQGKRFLEGLHRRWEAEEAARLALLVEGSRFLPHFRPRRWCWYVRTGGICPRGWNCTFAHHESELHPDPVPLVPLLHDVVPQMVEQLVDFLAPLDFRVAEKVIEVPKIVCPPRAARTVLGAPQTVEQLVEVPTEPAYALAVVAVQAIGLSAAMALAEQIVDKPVPQVRRGGGGGLQGFRAGQGTPAADMEQIVDFPVPLGRRRRSGSPQGSLPGRGSTANLEQIVDIPAREGLQGFLPGQGSSSSSPLHDGTDEEFKGFFALFPEGKKV